MILTNPKISGLKQQKCVYVHPGWQHGPSRTQTNEVATGSCARDKKTVLEYFALTDKCLIQR